MILALIMILVALIDMRVPGMIIEVEGIRVSPHSKFWIWEDRLYEPARYGNKLTGTYKPITDENRVERIMHRKNKAGNLPTISSTCDIEYNSQSDRFDLLDIRKD